MDRIGRVPTGSEVPPLLLYHRAGDSPFPQSIAEVAELVDALASGVSCNLCVNVCPVEDCITMEAMAPGLIDPRTGNVVEPEYANWTTHPNNPSAAAAE